MDKLDGREEALRLLVRQLPKDLKTVEANIEAQERWLKELSEQSMQESRIVLAENKITRLRVREAKLIFALEWAEAELKSSVKESAVSVDPPTGKIYYEVVDPDGDDWYSTSDDLEVVMRLAEREGLTRVRQMRECLVSNRKPPLTSMFIMNLMDMEEVCDDLSKIPAAITQMLDEALHACWKAMCGDTVEHIPTGVEYMKKDDVWVHGSAQAKEVEEDESNAIPYSDFSHAASKCLEFANRLGVRKDVYLHLLNASLMLKMEAARAAKSEATRDLLINTAAHISRHTQR